MEGKADSLRSSEASAEKGSAFPVQEQAWVLASQRGDSLAFNRLVLKWEKPIYNLVLRMLHDPDEAAETTQEVFLAAYKNVCRFRRDAKFSTWLYRIAVNHCISRMRSRPPGIHLSLDDREHGPGLQERLAPVKSHESDVVQNDSWKRVRRAVEHLTPDQKAVVELKFFQDLTFEEIAAIVQAPLSTVKSRLYSGLESLKWRLGSPGTTRDAGVQS